jgi:hypothetical protein
MWELCAMWAWTPMFLLTSYEQAAWSLQAARLAGFAVIAVGAGGVFWRASSPIASAVPPSPL